MDDSPLFGPGVGGMMRAVSLDDGAPAGRRLPVALDSVRHAQIGLPGASDMLVVVVGVDASGQRQTFAGTDALAPLALTPGRAGLSGVADGGGVPVEVRPDEARGYVAYRRLDARVGTVDLGGAPRSVALAAGFDATTYDDVSALSLMVNADGDGVFAPRLRTGPGESVAADMPFRIGGQAFRLSSVAPDGSEATFEALPDDTEALAAGFRMPDIALTSLDGTPMRVSELRGRVVVLNWWNDNCPPCYMEMPGLSELADTYAGDDRVAFVAIARNTTDELAAALDGRTFTYRQTVAADSAAAEALMGEGFPRHVVLDAQGRVVFDMLGGSPRIHEMLGPMIEPLVAVVPDRD